MRMLVAIANHGFKNAEFLQQVLDTYRSMPHEIDLVVHSDQPKDFGPDVEVFVGAPSSNPRSLPFAHRELFAQRRHDYDLFVYSEDDTLLTEQNIAAFLEVNAMLEPTEVPGFQRYEVHPSGERSYCSIHSTFRWLPGSIEARRGEIFAEHNNLHSAAYVLTRDHLEIALASGGFLVEPYQGAFSMMVSGATDPYVRCGLRRVLCVSRMDEFMLAHLPNVYLGKLGVPADEFEAQRDAIRDIAAGERSASELFDPTTRLPTFHWDVPQHAVPYAGLLEAVPDASQILSIGMTDGVLESSLFPQADRIVGLPIDEVVSAGARLRGHTVLEPRLDAAIDAMPPGGFEVMFFHECLEHFAHPGDVLARLRTVASDSCTLVIVTRNAAFGELRRLRHPSYAPPVPRAGFAKEGLHRPGEPFIRRLERTGLIGLTDVVGLQPPRRPGFDPRAVPRSLQRWLCDASVARGRFV